MLLVCGLQEIANAMDHRPTQAFIDSQGFVTVEDFTIMAVKDVPYMIKNHNSIHQQSVILGAVHQRKIQALIHWSRDHKCRGIAIVRIMLHWPTLLNELTLRRHQRSWSVLVN